MKKINANRTSIEKLLSGEKYTLGYFQREYNWGKENMIKLIEDLVDGFKRNQTGKPISYFLGSIIISEKNEELSLIDGQQRLTSLLLILIWIERAHSKISKEKILPLIYSEKNGVREYTIHDKDREEAMNNLYDKKKANNSNNFISTQNIMSNYNAIEAKMPSYKFDNERIEAFVHWLKNQVYVAKIEILLEKDSYKIFESANDRGLELKPAEMLKSYLLHNVDGHQEQMRLNDIWKNQIDDIMRLPGKQPDSEAIECWLRASLAKDQDDYNAIGGRFHHWIKDKSKVLGLNTSVDFASLVERDFCFYMKWYIELKKMAKEYKPEHEAVLCNAHKGFTLQYPVILSAISKDDNNREVILKKINVVATFIDIFIARHLWNQQTAKEINENKARFSMFKIIERIRGKDLNNIVRILRNEAGGYNHFDAYELPRFSDARYFLARFSSWLDREVTKKENNLPLYLKNTNYDVEHIMPNKYKWYARLYNKKGELEFENDTDFRQHRNKIGSLLLLQPPDNRRYQDLPYKKKLERYLGQDMILPKTLHKGAYEAMHELDKIKSKYRFESHDDKFMKDEIFKRNMVCVELAEAIWDVDRIKQAAED